MNKSESITKLASALCKVQSEIVDATKDKSGDRGKYKYADLGQLLNLIRPVITKYGLSVSQFPCEAVDNESVAVETILMHESGEWISNKFSMKLHRIVTKDGRDVTNAPQAAGSVITYARRYALAAVIGITQEDDDAQENREQKKRDLVPKISQQQIEHLTPWMTQSEPDGSNFGWSERGAAILSKYKVSQVGEILAKDYDAVLTNLQEA